MEVTPLESIQEINEQKKEYLRSYRAAVYIFATAVFSGGDDDGRNDY